MIKVISSTATLAGRFLLKPLCFLSWSLYAADGFAITVAWQESSGQTQTITNETSSGADVVFWVDGENSVINASQIVAEAQANFVADIVRVYDQGTLNISDSTLIGHSGDTFEVDTQGSLTLNNVTVHSEGGNLNGLFNIVGNGSVVVNGGSITADGELLDMVDGRVSFTDMTITALRGGYIQGNSSLTLSGVNLITQNYGVAIGADSEATIINSTIHSGDSYSGVLSVGTVSIVNTHIDGGGNGGYAFALSTYGSGVIDGDSVYITHSNSYQGVGAWTESGTITLRNSSIDLQNGELSAGVFALGSLSDSPILLELSDSSVNVSGTNVFGVVSAVQDGNTSLPNVILTNTDVTMQGERAYAYNASGLGASLTITGGGATTDGSNAYGLKLRDRASVTVIGTSISTAGADSSAIYTSYEAQSTGNALTVDSSAIAARDAAVVKATGDLTLNLTNGTTLNAQNGNAAILASDGYDIGFSFVTPVPDVYTPAGSVVVNADASTINGDVIQSSSDGSGSLALSLKNGSAWQGAAKNVSQIEIDDASQWLVNGDSSFGALNNTGLVKVDSSVVLTGAVNNAGAIVYSSPAAGGAFRTLTVNGDYHGNGQLLMNVALGGDDSPSDRLVVNGDTSGTTSVHINNVGGLGAQTVNGIEVIDVNGASSGVFTQSNQVQAGLYEYRLYQDANSGDWYLRSQASGPEPVTPQYRADTGAYLGNQWMARSLQMQSLYDREGSQLRSDDGSVWMRFKSGAADSTAASGYVDIDSRYSQIQLGGDVLAWRYGEQSLDVGLMGSYITADTDSTGNRGADGSRFSASGHVDGYNLGVYATWFADAQAHRGMYVDSWYQYGMYDNSVDNGDAGSTRYDSTANAASLEVGYRYDIALNSGNSIGLTPQAQAVWQNYSADGVKDGNGSRIDGQNGDDWTTRLGLRVDGRLRKDANVIQPFVEASWLHASDGTTVSFDNAQTRQEMPSDRAELKVGIQANIGSRLSVTAQASGQKGSHGYGDANFGLNVRYGW
ncbi:hypothetical protein SOASR030_36860 [Leminorella grimontii]|uniref:Autotransporter domain-containing protein n=1 Tax=Leminorella grimontii TaxID=82981 RepID=A0AAV5N8X3_9GAMM|nr:autotransporter outer membrane beta-barrel domain-containing protein [Leminorella grimontii]KFC94235.1 AIDA autotransporter-like protein [Leminorella grimontii ATCC 33999 = DSM 5078]GKX57574.1 hypothetical protein SOASR030_36860 [Leminorella grimontii]VFS54670.1 Outer membrane protein IcsA autotransporter precursor [Leminorella grimontii]